MKKSTERFTQTVAAYTKYRPGYPAALLQVLQKDCHLTPEKIIADVGSGTGLLTELFLKNGNTVYGIEPNAPMRTAGEEYLVQYPRFISIAGSAEATTLPDHSVDMITAGTAFHWFEMRKTKIEFQRILKKEGWVVLVWNVRDKQSPLIRDYEQLISQYGTDYCQTAASRFDQPELAAFFSPHPMQVFTIQNKQEFDWEGLQGRLLSTSYCPNVDDPQYPVMMQKLREIYERYQKDQQVEFLYATKVYYGRIYEE